MNAPDSAHQSESLWRGEKGPSPATVAECPKRPTELQSTQQSSPSSSQSPVVIQSKHCAALHGCCSALCAEPWTLGWFWLVKIFSRLIVTEADSHVARRFSTKVLSGSHSKLQPISVSQPGQAASFLQPRWAPRRQR